MIENLFRFTFNNKLDIRTWDDPQKGTPERKIAVFNKMCHKT